MHSLYIFLLTVHCFLLISHPENDAAATTRNAHVLVQIDPTDSFVKDLKTFVRSISGQKYQTEQYWNQVDVLWVTMQERKQNLMGQFNDEQRKQIRKWEKRYNNLRKKKLKHA
jgi:hypothetical protein